MKFEDIIFNNIDQFIGPEDDLDSIPVPENIQKIANSAERELKRIEDTEAEEAASPGIFSTLKSLLQSGAPSVSPNAFAFGIDGTEEKEETDDPLDSFSSNDEKSDD